MSVAAVNVITGLALVGEAAADGAPGVRGVVASKTTVVVRGERAVAGAVDGDDAVGVRARPGTLVSVKVTAVGGVGVAD